MARKSKGAKSSEASASSESQAVVADALDEAPVTLVETGVLDEVLSLQLLVAWAGEGKTDPPRLGWWRTSLVDEFGGEDLFTRLMPRTWRWAVLEAARTAARIVDAEARSHAADGDQLISLFHFGFELDEQLDDRLAELKRSERDPTEAHPRLAQIRQPWNAETLLASLRELGSASTASSSLGRRLKGAMPNSRIEAARLLAAAMVPLADRYPAPHWKLG